MDTYYLLRDKARARRDNIIKQARADYWRTIRQIEQLVRTLGEERHRQALATPVAPCDESESLRGITAIKAAEIVLLQGPSLTLIELAIELRRRGIQATGDPRKLVRSLRASFRYHHKKYRRDAKGRWSVAE